MSETCKQLTHDNFKNDPAALAGIKTINLKAHRATILLKESFVVSVEEENAVTTPPTHFSLEQNYPNPFNPQTTIRYKLYKQEIITLEIYNVAGQLVRRLIEEVQQSGEYSIIWRGSDEKGNQISSGVYMYVLKAGGFVMTKKMVLIK